MSPRERTARAQLEQAQRAFLQDPRPDLDSAIRRLVADVRRMERDRQARAEREAVPAWLRREA